ncbi:hypothetical protein [Aurantivibrio plasticivorans]
MNITVQYIFELKPSCILNGLVESGRVQVGDLVRISSPASHLEAKIKGVEVDRKVVSSAKAGNQVSLLFNNIDLSEISDGIKVEPNQTGIEVVSLNICESAKKWWHIW